MKSPILREVQGRKEIFILGDKNQPKEKIMDARKIIVTLAAAGFFLCMSLLSVPMQGQNVKNVDKTNPVAWTLAKVIGPSPAFAEQAGKAQEVCPITGKKIDKSVYLDYKGKRVYFCCPGCKATFLKDPDKYIKTMEAEGVKLDTTPGETNEPAH